MPEHLVSYASIGPIAVHLPEKVETNEYLQAEYPNWDLSVIESKTGISQRHIAAENECSSDLGVIAAKKLFDNHNVDPQSIDYVLFCTQTPDYPLPTTACLIQNRLGLRTNIGAFDFNLGCSGFVYGLSIADGLIQSGAAKNVLLITAETYSKFIHPTDRSLRTIFGDGAAATLIESSEQQSMRQFRFGTDGSGGDTLLVTEGGYRNEDDALKPRHRKRWPSQLYMDGPSLLSFTVGAIPKIIDEMLGDAGLSSDEVQYYLMHQATRKMLEQLQSACKVEAEKIPIRIKDIGNTVSCTIPILINDMRSEGNLSPDQQNLLVGFGVGWSWACCVWQDQWSRKN